jgi:predicted dehydrogenase
MRRLRIGVVGVGAQAGSRARQYISTLARLTDHYELTALCDRNEEALRQVADEYRTPARYTDARALFSSERLDVVLSMAPKDAHIVIALAAARRGAHVLTEIPVALTRRYAEAISRTCREHGVLWEVAEQVWLWPKERLKRRVIESGLLGKVTHARLWYQTGQYHGFSAIRALLGSEATRVLGYCGEVETDPYEAYGGEPESTIRWDSAVIEFGGGAVCLFEKPPRIFPFPNRTFPVGWQVEGTGGYWDRDRLTLYHEREPRTYEIEERYVEVKGERALDEVRVATDPPVVWENPFKGYGIGSPDDVSKASILTSFHEAIAQGGRPQYGAENGLRDWELCLAVRESAHLGNAWVPLPLGPPTELERRIEAEFLQRYGHDPIEETDALLHAAFTRSATLWEAAHWL